MIKEIRTEVICGCTSLLFGILIIGLVSYVFTTQHKYAAEYSEGTIQLQRLSFAPSPTPFPTPINTPIDAHCNRFTIKLAGIWQVGVYESSIDSTTDNPITTIEFVPVEE